MSTSKVYQATSGRLSSYYFTEDGVIGITKLSLLSRVAVLAFGVLLAFLVGTLIALAVVIVGYVILWQIASKRTDDFKNVLKDGSSRVVTIRRFSWSDVQSATLDGENATLTLMGKRYQCRIHKNNVEAVKQLLISRIGDRFGQDDKKGSTTNTPLPKSS
jgi:hypothetical protein